MYYVYVSDNKVDQLYSKVRKTFLGRIAAELGIGLPPLSLKLSGKDDPLGTEETKRYRRLETVTKHIRKNFPVGTIDDPSEYFEGTLPMIYLERKKTNIVLFVGKTDETTLALFGSSHQMTGALQKPSSSSGVEGTGLIADIDAAFEVAVSTDKIDFNPGIEYIMPLMHGPELKFEFLAQKFHHEKRSPDKQTILIGSPMYITLAQQ
jgi:Family of unknown function (DUF7019)